MLVHNACPMCIGNKKKKIIVHAEKTVHIPYSPIIIDKVILKYDCDCGPFFDDNKNALLDAGVPEKVVNAFCELTNDPENFDEKYEALMKAWSDYEYPKDVGLVLLEKSLKSPIYSRERKHYVERFRRNNYAIQLEYDLKALSDNYLKVLADRGYTVTRHFDEMTWTLSPSWRSIYHSRQGDGTDCFKWVSDAGHELVINCSQQKPHLEIHPEYIGTFNYGQTDLWHIIEDILPYHHYGDNFGNYPNKWHERPFQWPPCPVCL